MGRMVLIVIAILVVGVAGFFWSSFRGVANRVANPDNIIENYEWFHEANQDYQALALQIEAATASRDSFAELAGDRSGWTFEDRTEYNRLNTVVLGLTNRRLSLAADYNARSRMINRNLFKDGNLPYELE